MIEKVIRFHAHGFTAPTSESFKVVYALRAYQLSQVSIKESMVECALYSKNCYFNQHWADFSSIWCGEVVCKVWCQSGGIWRCRKRSKKCTKNIDIFISLGLKYFNQSAPNFAHDLSTPSGRKISRVPIDIAVFGKLCSLYSIAISMNEATMRFFAVQKSTFMLRIFALAHAELWTLLFLPVQLCLFFCLFARGNYFN